MLISDLTYHHGEAFSGEYRISDPILRFTKYGYPYITVSLGDMSGSLKGYLWLDRDDDQPDLAGSERASVCAHLRSFNGKWIAIIQRIDAVAACKSHPVALMPAWASPLGYLLPRLHDLVMSVENKSLHSFLVRIFDDDSIAFPFVAVPGSASHHHAYGGGLLEHSLECSEIVMQMPLFTSEIRELGVVAALLHDVGKIMTLTPAVKLSRAGFLLSHDALTLEVLGPHLRGLDEEWPDGAAALRYLLTWKNHRRKTFPLMTIAEAVSAADRISSGTNREADAFSTLPPWRNATSSLYGNGFWRPILYLDADKASHGQQSLGF